MVRWILSVAMVAAMMNTGLSQETKPAKAKADPEGTPLELIISGKTTKFTLDTGGLTPAEFKKKIENATDPNGRGGRPPATPAVDLTVEIKNTSDKAVQVWTKGDPVTLTLELKGKGALNVAPLLAFTQEFRLPQAVEIAAGKTHSMEIKSLVSGFRGASVFSYWTAPGEYELVATLKTGMQPAPKGAQDFDGFGVVTLTSAPLKLTVEEKK